MNGIYQAENKIDCEANMEAKQKMTIHSKVDGAWQTLTPNLLTVTARELMAYAGTDTMVHWQDVHRTIYAYGNTAMREELQAKYPADQLCMMDCEAFGFYWQYKLLELGLDTFTKAENAEERAAIMTEAGETEQAAAEYMATRPDLYQTTFEWPSDF